MVVLKIIGIVLLVLLALLLVALFLPVHVKVEYEQELTVVGRYLFLHRKILPSKEPEEKSEDALPPEEETEEPKEEPPKEEANLLETIAFFYRFAQEHLPEAGTLLHRLLRMVHLRKTEIQMVVAAEEVSQTGVYFGAANALLGGLCALFATIFTMKDPDLRIYPDFMGSESHLSFNLDFSLRLLTLILLIPALLRLFLAFRRARGAVSKQKGEKGKNA